LITDSERWVRRSGTNEDAGAIANAAISQTACPADAYSNVPAVTGL
jgi:hypothetical protein